MVCLPLWGASCQVVTAVRKVTWVGLLAWTGVWGPFVQMFFASLFLALCVALQAWVRPFKQNWANRLEMTVLTTLWFTTVACLPGFAGVGNSISKGMLWTALALNGCTLLLFSVLLARELPGWWKRELRPLVKKLPDPKALRLSTIRHVLTGGTRKSDVPLSDGHTTLNPAYGKQSSTV
jgi:hypothetical protein